MEDGTKDSCENEEHTSPSDTPKIDEVKSIKIEPDSEHNIDRMEGFESVIKKINIANDTDVKRISPFVKNEPVVSPVPNTGSLNEQEYLGIAQSLHSGNNFVWDFNFKRLN